jgi:hypothetical protein
VWAQASRIPAGSSSSSSSSSSSFINCVQLGLTTTSICTAIPAHQLQLVASISCICICRPICGNSEQSAG